jgi:hypothetical protein
VQLARSQAIARASDEPKLVTWRNLAPTFALAALKPSAPVLDLLSPRWRRWRSRCSR